MFCWFLADIMTVKASPGLNPETNLGQFYLCLDTLLSYNPIHLQWVSSYVARGGCACT